jgi:hypothetical protein
MPAEETLGSAGKEGSYRCAQVGCKIRGVQALLLTAISLSYFDEAFTPLKTSAPAGTPVTLFKPAKPARGEKQKTWKRKSRDR